MGSKGSSSIVRLPLEGSYPIEQLSRSSAAEGSPHLDSYACAFREGKPPLENNSTNISLRAPITSAIEILTSLGDQRLTTLFSSATEVLTSLEDQHLSAQFNSAIEVLTSLREQMSVRSETKTPFRDGIADTLYSCHLKVRPPKGYDYFTMQITQDPNNSVIFKIHSITFH